MVAQGRRLTLIRLTRPHRVAAAELFDYPPDGESAEQNSCGPFVKIEAGGRFFGSGRKLLEEPHFGRSIEGGN